MPQMYRIIIIVTIIVKCELQENEDRKQKYFVEQINAHAYTYTTRTERKQRIS